MDRNKATHTHAVVLNIVIATMEKRTTGATAPLTTRCLGCQRFERTTARQAPKFCCNIPR
jgi:hypothetical protein